MLASMPETASSYPRLTLADGGRSLAVEYKAHGGMKIRSHSTLAGRRACP
jgi:hypothetical protein